MWQDMWQRRRCSYTAGMFPPEILAAYLAAALFIVLALTGCLLGRQAGRRRLSWGVAAGDGTWPRSPRRGVGAAHNPRHSGQPLQGDRMPARDSRSCLPLVGLAGA